MIWRIHLFQNNSEQQGGVSLYVGVFPQIKYINIPILPLKNGSNIVHDAQPPCDPYRDGSDVTFLISQVVPSLRIEP